MKILDTPKSAKGCWTDLSSEDAHLVEKFGINPQHLSYDMKRNFPRYAEREGHTAIALFTPTPGSAGGFSRRRILIYVFPYALVSIGAGDLFDWFHSECVKEIGMKSATKEEVVHQLLSEIVRRQENALADLDARTSQMEENIAEKKVKLDLPELFRKKRLLIRLSKQLWREREIVQDFMNGHVQYLRPSKKLRQRAEDLRNALLFDMNSVENMRDILTDALEIHHTLVSNGINRSIEKLTVVTVMLTIVATVSAFPNTIATIFGVPYLPLQAERAVVSIGGYDVLPWHMVLGLIAIFTLLPTMLLSEWWKKEMKRE